MILIPARIRVNTCAIPGGKNGSKVARIAFRPYNTAMEKTVRGKIIYLVGFMGSGKTTVGRELADRCALPFFDTDCLLEERFGKSIPEVFASCGEAFFRAEESALLRNLPAALDGEAAVVSCGGGIVLSPENRGYMRDSGTVVYLSVSPGIVIERLSGDAGRPLLIGKGPDDIRKMMDERRPLYEEAADLTSVTDGKSPGQIAEEIISVLRGGSD